MRNERLCFPKQPFYIVQATWVKELFGTIVFPIKFGIFDGMEKQVWHDPTGTTGLKVEIEQLMISICESYGRDSYGAACPLPEFLERDSEDGCHVRNLIQMHFGQAVLEEVDGVAQQLMARYGPQRR
jgi:hypothetical protein